MELSFHLIFPRKQNMTQCTHTEQIQKVTPSAQGCEECLKLGDSWVHLRMCLICGHVSSRVPLRLTSARGRSSAATHLKTNTRKSILTLQNIQSSNLLNPMKTGGGVM